MNLSKNPSRKESPVRLHKAGNIPPKFPSQLFNIQKGVCHIPSQPADYFINYSEKFQHIMSSTTDNEGNLTPSVDNTPNNSDKQFYLKENGLLRLQISELENEIEKLKETNSAIISYNKNLEAKVGFYQKKVQAFTEIYNQVITLVNSIFKKVGDFLIEKHNLNEDSPNKQQTVKDPKQIIKQKIDFLFMNEMTDLKFVFKNLQNSIDQINEEALSFRTQHGTDYLPQLSKIFDSGTASPLLQTNEYPSLNKRATPQPSSTNKSDREKSNFDTEECETRRSELHDPHSRPVTSRENIHTIQENGTELETEHSSEEASKEISVSQSKLFDKAPPLMCYHKKPIPFCRTALRDEIQKRLATEKTLNHSRNNSLATFFAHANFKSTKNLKENHTAAPSRDTSICPEPDKKRCESVKIRAQEQRQDTQQTNSIDKAKTLKRNASLKSYIKNQFMNTENSSLKQTLYETKKESRPALTERSNIFTERYYQDHYTPASNNDSSNNIHQDTIKNSRQNSYENIKHYRNMKDNFHLDISKLQKYTENKLKKYGFYKEVLTSREGNQ